jgi:ATP-dependent helicase HepA
MILNGLRWQNPQHKAVIVVPDRLVSQWQGECWTRGHCVAGVGGKNWQEKPGEPFVRIIRPQSIQSDDFRLDPNEFDLLIVDEPQTMPELVMGKIERIAPDLRQLLVLSATPGLGDPARRRRMMKLLEPERVITAELSGTDADRALTEIETTAIAMLATRGSTVGTKLYCAYSSERRVVRARRAEWGRYLPERRHEQISVEPLKGEAERVKVGMRWLEAVGLARTEEGWRFAQALHRGGRSARLVVANRMRRGAGADGLAAVGDASSEPGDSRFDALLDILRELWAQDSRRQVVVVAGDNPTIDFLSARLSRYFGSEGEPLEVTELRRASESSDDEAEDIREMYERLDAFIRGRSKVLLVGEWIQAGLNLHYYSRDIVFYSPPWNAEAVDQLIGRLDRLRPNGLRRGDSGRAFGRVRTWCITQAGTVEARIVAGLEATAVFNRPLPLVPPEEAAKIRDALRSLAFGNDVEGAVQTLSDLASRWDGEWAFSRLADLNPYTPSAALAAHERLNSQPLPEPVLKHPGEWDDGYTARAEVAVQGWLDLLEKAHFFGVSMRNDRVNDFRFTTIWHLKGTAPTVPVPELEGPNWLDGHAPFLVRRKHLSTPPRNKVVTDDGEPDGRLLRFLDHGEALHESLVRGFMELAQRTICDPMSPRACVVVFPEGHPALQFAGQTLLVQVAYADPGEAALSPFNSRRLRDLVDAAPTEAQKVALEADVRSAEEAWRSDQRWLRSMLPAMTLAATSRIDGNEWTPINDEAKWEILKPLAYGELTVCAKASPFHLPPPKQVTIQGAREQMVRIITELRAAWKLRGAELRSALVERRLQTEVEAADRLRLRQAELAMRQLRAAGTERFKDGLVAAEERRISMADVMAEARATWLDAIPKLMEQAKPKGVGLLIIRPAPMDNG